MKNQEPRHVASHWATLGKKDYVMHGKNNVNALHAFMAGSMQKNPECLRMLGKMHWMGDCTAQDTAMAIKFTEESANLGNVKAMIDVGNYYKSGDLQDFDKAVTWYTCAVDLGSKDAQSSLGELYEYGIDHGFGMDVVKAIEWFIKSADSGDVWSMRTLGFLYAQEDTEVYDLSKAISWYTKAGEEHGNRDSLIDLGKLRYHGKVKDNKEALRLYEMAAEIDEFFCVSLGDILMDGKHIDRDVERAIYWYRRAVTETGRRYEDGAKRLADIYCKGDGVPVDIEEGMRWHRKAAINCSDSQFDLAELYRKGDMVPKDVEKAIYWYKKAAKGNRENFGASGYTLFRSYKAMCALGDMHYFGDGIGGVNHAEALSWYKKVIIDFYGRIKDDRFARDIAMNITKKCHPFDE